MTTATDRPGWLHRAAMAAHADAVQADEERIRRERRNYEDTARQALQDAVARVIGIVVDVSECPWGRAEDGEDRPHVMVDGLEFAARRAAEGPPSLILVERCRECHTNKRGILIASLAELGRLISEDRGRYCCSACGNRVRQGVTGAAWAGAA